MIHQHFMLVPTLTVAENVALGLRSSRGPLSDLEPRGGPHRASCREAYGLKVEPEAFVWQLSVGERQRVEIIKALYRDAPLLILDEPTAVLTPREVDDLFAVLRQMVARRPGRWSSSRTRCARCWSSRDRITVLRGGQQGGHASRRVERDARAARAT